MYTKPHIDTCKYLYVYTRTYTQAILHTQAHTYLRTRIHGQSKEKLIRGTVRLIFQPAEEGGAGALMMREQVCVYLSTYICVNVFS